MISIIIPAHNAEKSIQRCILSWIDQIYNDLEIIIVENGSNDNTLSICQELAGQDDRICLVRTEEMGVSNARNMGIRCARGDIIGFCDADDYVEKIDFFKVENLMKEYQMLVFGYNDVTDEGEIIKTNIEGGRSIDTPSVLIDNVFLNERIMGSVWNKFFRKEILNDIFFHKELSYCEDTNFLIRVLASNINIKIKYIPRVIYNYVCNPKGVTNDFQNMFAGRELKYVQALECIKKDCVLSECNQSSLNAAIVNICMNFLSPIIYCDFHKYKKSQIDYMYNCLKLYKKDYLASNYIKIKRKIKLLLILFERNLMFVKRRSDIFE